MEMKPDLAIVSMHEKGFPQGDFYEGCGDMPAMEFEALGMAPDDFFTLKRGDTLASAMEFARQRWPTAKVVEADEDEDESEDWVLGQPSTED